MLKGINPILTGDLLKVLSDMGHDDTIVVTDGNYAAWADATRRPPVQLYGYGTLEIVRAILEVMPLNRDSYQVRAGYITERSHDGDSQLPHWQQFMECVGPSAEAEPVDRKKFHDFAREAYAIVATNDPTLYACYILRKGVVESPAAGDAIAPGRDKTWLTYEQVRRFGLSNDYSRQTIGLTWAKLSRFVTSADNESGNQIEYRGSANFEAGQRQMKIEMDSFLRRFADRDFSALRKASVLQGWGPKAEEFMNAWMDHLEECIP